MRKIIAVFFLATCAFAAPSYYGDRIVGGMPASKGQFPHQASIRVNNQHICGGSIISANRILTAAHCVFGNNLPMTVVVGETLLNIVGQTHRVYRTVSHVEYNAQTNMNDIAIITLSTSILFNNNIRAISLRSHDSMVSESLTLSGWGRTSESGNIPNQLQYLKMAVVSLETCATQLTGANPIGLGHICTGSPSGQGVCMGDSGGPLIDANGQQIGIVSWNIPCARGYPDVFTSVPYYLSWINSNYIQTPCKVLF